MNGAKIGTMIGRWVVAALVLGVPYFATADAAGYPTAATYFLWTVGVITLTAHELRSAIEDISNRLDRIEDRFPHSRNDF